MHNSIFACCVNKRLCCVSVEDLPVPRPTERPVETEVIIPNPDVEVAIGGQATLTCQTREERRLEVESIVWSRLLGNLPPGM